jgi:molecular chaperone Hsp33
MLEILLEGFDIEFTDKMPVQFFCNCTKSRVEKALISVGKKELKNMIEDGKTIEVNCHFCNRDYEFTVEELEAMYRKAVR